MVDEWDYSLFVIRSRRRSRRTGFPVLVSPPLWTVYASVVGRLLILVTFPFPSFSLFFCLHSAWYIRYTYCMSNKTLKKLLNERARLLGEMGTLSRMLHGSWVERFSVCSRPGCRCHSGDRHGPRHYLVVREDGRQRQKYIPNSQVPAAQAGLAEYRRVLEIIDRITHINLKLMKEGAYED